MNQDIFGGKWEELKGKVKEKWGKLTDDDWTEIEGNTQQLYGKLQQHYGYTREQIDREIDELTRH